MIKVLAIDGNSILNRAYYGIRLLTNSKGVPTNALTGFLNIIFKHLEQVKPDKTIIAFDKKSPTFRHKMYEEYKSNRKGMPEELATQFPIAKEIAQLMGFEVLEYDGFEADDLLGTVSSLCDKQGAFCYILTGDRDALQLINDSYACVLLAGNSDTVLYDEAKFFEKYQTKPFGLIDIKALMGDSSDCIPGVKGIGEKTALSLIAQYGNIDKVYENIDNLPIGNSAKMKIAAGKDMAYLSKKLATINCNVDISVDLSESTTIRLSELTELLSELEMFSVLKKATIFANLEKTAKLSDLKNETSSFEETTVDINDLYSKVSCDCIYLSADLEALKLCLSDGNAVYCSNCNNKKELCDFIVKHIAVLEVFDSKKVYRFLLENKIVPKVLFSFDVMLAAYVVNSGLQKYTPERVIANYLHITDENLTLSQMAYYTAKLSEILKKELEESGQKDLYFKIELPLSLVIADMEHTGFYVDGQGLSEFGKQLEKDIAEHEERIYFLTGEKFNINSPKQLGNILFEKMGIPSKKKTKTGYATDAETLEPLVRYHPVISEILDYRALTKLKSTFIDSMIVQISPKDGRIHTSFNQATTATGRLSSAEPNLQNIPIRQQRGKELRKYFGGTGNKVLVDADYSQIELRLLAEISEDEKFINTFVNGEDIHRSTAAQVFGIPDEFVSSELRSRAKAINFGIVYGISAFSLAKDISTSVADAKTYIDNYLSKYVGVSTYLNEIVKKARENGYVTTLFGRRRYIPELASSKKQVQGFGERVARNSPIQGTAADIIKLAMVNVYNKLKEFPNAKLVLQVHDELIIETAPDCAKEVSEMLKNEMEKVYKTSVPLSVEVKIGKTWYEAKE